MEILIKAKILDESEQIRYKSHIIRRGKNSRTAYIYVPKNLRNMLSKKIKNWRNIPVSITVFEEKFIIEFDSSRKIKKNTRIG